MIIYVHRVLAQLLCRAGSVDIIHGATCTESVRIRRKCVIKSTNRDDQFITTYEKLITTSRYIHKLFTNATEFDGNCGVGMSIKLLLQVLSQFLVYINEVL